MKPCDPGHDFNDFFSLYKSCCLCPRACQVDRTDTSLDARLGFCRQASIPVIASVCPHFGEEPPFSGTHGSGTVFFSGCTLRCSFCQNYQISHRCMGKESDTEAILKKLTDMIQTYHVHNINFVTPDHFFPHVFHITGLLRNLGYKLPVIYNLSGYQAVNMLKLAEPYVDIYLPDFKFSDPDLAKNLAGRKDYPKTAIEAISEMVKQKGFLDSFSSGKKIASKGVLVRHLILPGYTDNSIDALSTLFIEFGPKIPVSIMSQYYPVKESRYKSLNRMVSRKEFDKVYSHAIDLGFEHLFVQYPEDMSASSSPFLPDFTQARPFGKSMPCKQPLHLQHGNQKPRQEL